MGRLVRDLLFPPLHRRNWEGKLLLNIPLPLGASLCEALCSSREALVNIKFKVPACEADRFEHLLAASRRNPCRVAKVLCNGVLVKRRRRNGMELTPTEV